jgi:hypothetical protein
MGGRHPQRWRRFGDYSTFPCAHINQQASADDKAATTSPLNIFPHGIRAT